MFRKKTRWIGLAAMIAGAAAILTFGPRAVVPSATAYAPQTVINDPNLIFPRTRIITLGGNVMRFDTATGEMLRFNGDLSGSDARGTWRRFTRPVTGDTSGFLDLRPIGEGTFLVDLEEGNTWILRRGSTLGTWIRVNVLSD